MKTTLFTQPFDINNGTAQFGLTLINLINSRSPLYTEIWCVSAFANSKAVKRMVQPLLEAISNGTIVHMIVGIDHQGTSVEALQVLLDAGLQTIIVHNSQPGHTFHPKIYLLEAASVQAKLFVGSHNLTEGGLFTNYEASAEITFDLPIDEDEYQTFRHQLSRFFNPPASVAQPLSQALIDNLFARGEIITEQQQKVVRQSVLNAGLPAAQPKPSSLFGSEKVTPAPRMVIKRARVKKVSPPGNEHRILVWQKENLGKTDAQRPSGHPTGGLRLVQANWRWNGELIDQESFFRFELFSKFDWQPKPSKKLSLEDAYADFRVFLLGQDYGVHRLRISYAPERAADQGNYTTILHWGELGRTIRDVNVIGKTVRLYAPVEDNIFIIEIS